MKTKTDSYYINCCINLAMKAGGHVWNNPFVGCVIVHNGKIIGEGYHKKFGEPHAEVNAIASVKNKKLLSKSTLYVNLEPCCHFGKTPPCTDLIIKHQIKKVVIGMKDPNPLVSGKGIEKLVKAGIEIQTDVEIAACEFLNRRFIVNQKFKRPYVVLKWAQTKDGFIAPENLQRTQISNSQSQKEVFKLRSWCGAVLVGYRTALYDNPQLTVRNTKAPQIKFRVVIDEKNELPKTGKLFNGEIRTLVFNSKISEVRKNFELVKIRSAKFLLVDLIRQLQSLGVPAILVEGGTATLKKFIAADLWDEAHVYVSSKKFKKGLPAPTLNLQETEKIKSGTDSHLKYFNHQ